MNDELPRRAPPTRPWRPDDDAPRVTTRDSLFATGSVIELPGGGSCMIERLISTGTGEADVYAVRLPKGEARALKVYRAFDDPEDEPKGEVLEKVMGIDCPNVLRLYAFGVGERRLPGGRCWELSDLALGGSLHELCGRRGLFEEAEILEVARQCTIGLKALLEQTVYHCDLKPQNLLFLDAALTTLVIADFGAARTRLTPGLDVTTRPKGTAYYRAPELAMDALAVLNLTADYYSLGMVLLQLGWLGSLDDLAREYPFLFTKIIQRAPIVPFRGRTRGRADDLVNHLTMSSFEVRWGTAEVERWLAGEPIARRYPSRVQPFSIKLTGGGTKSVGSMDELIEVLGPRGAPNAYAALPDDTFEDLRTVVRDLRGTAARDNFRAWCSELASWEGDRASDLFRAGLRHYLRPELPIAVGAEVTRNDLPADPNPWWREFTRHLVNCVAPISRAQLQQNNHPVTRLAKLALLSMQAALRGTAEGDDRGAAAAANALTRSIVKHVPGRDGWHRAWVNGDPLRLALAWFYEADPERGCLFGGQEYRTAAELLGALDRAPELLDNELALLAIQTWTSAEANRQGHAELSSGARKARGRLEVSRVLWQLGAERLSALGCEATSVDGLVGWSDEALRAVLDDGRLQAWPGAASCRDAMERVMKLQGESQLRVLRWLAGEKMLRLFGQTRVTTIPDLLVQADQHPDALHAILPDLPYWLEFTGHPVDVASVYAAGPALTRLGANPGWLQGWRAEQMLRRLGAKGSTVKAEWSQRIGDVKEGSSSRGKVKLTATAGRGRAYGRLVASGRTVPVILVTGGEKPRPPTTPATSPVASALAFLEMRGSAPVAPASRTDLREALESSRPRTVRVTYKLMREGQTRGRHESDEASTFLDIPAGQTVEVDVIIEAPADSSDRAPRPDLTWHPAEDGAPPQVIGVPHQFSPDELLASRWIAPVLVAASGLCVIGLVWPEFPRTIFGYHLLAEVWQLIATVVLVVAAGFATFVSGTTIADRSRVQPWVIITHYVVFGFFVLVSGVYMLFR